MAQYIQPRLATELVGQMKRTRRSKEERKERIERASTIIKDDNLWKELQQELAKSKCISRASVQETTRNFMEKRRAQLDEQARAQRQRDQSAGNRRRSSISTTYPCRRSSMSYVSNERNRVHRTLSMEHGTITTTSHHEPRSKSDSSVGGFVNYQLSKMNTSSLDRSKLPIPENIAPASSIHQQRQAELFAASTQRPSSVSEKPRRRSSMSSISKIGNNMHRNLSMRHGTNTATTQYKPRSRRNSIFGGLTNQLFPEVNNPSSKLSSNSSKLPIQEKFFPASSRSRANDNNFDVLNQASTISDKLDAMNEAPTQSLSIEEQLGGADDGAHDDGFGERSPGRSEQNGASELLVLFPTEPRQRTQCTRDATARSA